VIDSTTDEISPSGGTGTFVIDTKTNEITKADYTMLVHIDVKHANVAHGLAALSTVKKDLYFYKSFFQSYYSFILLLLSLYFDLQDNQFQRNSFKHGISFDVS